MNGASREAPPVDVVVVGSGAAGMTAALASHSKKLRYVVLEQDSIGGTIFHYPRQKLVLTSPVVLPLHGTVKVSEITKEEQRLLISEGFLSLLKKYIVQEEEDSKNIPAILRKTKA